MTLMKSLVLNDQSENSSYSLLLQKKKKGGNIFEIHVLNEINYPSKW